MIISTSAQPDKWSWFRLRDFTGEILFDLYTRFLAIGNRSKEVGETLHKHSLCTTSLLYLNWLDFYKFRFWKMFTAYHAIMFAVLLIGGLELSFKLPQ